MLADALSFTAAIGGSHLCGVIYSALAKYPGPPTAAGRANCVRSLQLLADQAADQGITLCLEVINRYGWGLYLCGLESTSSRSVVTR